MKARLFVAAANIGFMFLLVLGMRAEAAEVKVLSAFGMQSVLEDLGPEFERATGHKLAISLATGGAIVKRFQGGESADVVITLRQGIDSLVKARQGIRRQRDRAGPCRHFPGGSQGHTQA
jgi:molybdate transport system substrate-binding protein